MKKQVIFSFFAVILMVAVDQITKLMLIEKNYSLLLFNLRYVENTGAAFGLFKDANPLLILINLAVVFLILNYIMRIKHRLGMVGFLFILAGALSNLMDRIIHGYVIDFIDFIIWPVFNLADVYIVAGIFLLIIFVKH